MVWTTTWRADFFGSQGDTGWNQERLAREHPNFVHGCVKEEPPGASGLQEHLIAANNET